MRPFHRNLLNEYLCGAGKMGECEESRYHLESISITFKIFTGYFGIQFLLFAFNDSLLSLYKYVIVGGSTET